MFFLFLLSQATALIDYHIFCRLSTTFLFFSVSLLQLSQSLSSDSLFTLSHPTTFCQELFFKFFFAFFILHFPYPARAVQCFLFCIGCLSDEDYLITSLSNCQRFSCFLFNSHNSDNSAIILLLYT